MTKKRAPKASRRAADASPVPQPPMVPPPESARVPPPAAPASTPSSPPPSGGAWPQYKLGEGYVVGGRYPRPGPAPVLRKASDDPHGIRRGLMDAPRTSWNKDEDMRDMADLLGDVRKVCPY